MLFQHAGNWTDTSSFHESTDWDATMALVFVGDTNVDLLIGQGPDHSIFDIYVDGTLYESVDGYTAVASSRVVSIDLKGDAWHGLEIRNRHEQNMQSSGYKVRFASLSVDTALMATVIDYSYDDLSRLIETDYNNGASVYNYGYDVAGNMVDYDGVTRTFNDANQMTNDGTNTLTYDNNGNLRTVGSDTYTWDRANRLLSVGNHSYVYDGLGNRVQQTVSSVVTDYLNDIQPGLVKLLRQDDGTNVEKFVHGVRGVHAVDDGTDWNFYAQDGLGSVRAVVDDAGVVQSSLAYDSYGNFIGTPPTGSYIGFTGEQTDENGSVFLRARYYEPELGVFSALDPFEGFQDIAMSLNGYSWVHGNPVMNTDPTGLTCQCDIYLPQAGKGGDIDLYTACITNPANQHDNHTCATDSCLPYDYTLPNSNEWDSPYSCEPVLVGDSNAIVAQKREGCANQVYNAFYSSIDTKTAQMLLAAVYDKELSAVSWSTSAQTAFMNNYWAWVYTHCSDNYECSKQELVGWLSSIEAWFRNGNPNGAPSIQSLLNFRESSINVASQTLNEMGVGCNGVEACQWANYAYGTDDYTQIVQGQNASVNQCIIFQRWEDRNDNGVGDAGDYWTDYVFITATGSVGTPSNYNQSTGSRPTWLDTVGSDNSPNRNLRLNTWYQPTCPSS